MCDFRSSKQIEKDKIELDRLILSLFGITSDKIFLELLIYDGYDIKSNGQYDPMWEHIPGQILKINTKGNTPIITIIFKNMIRSYSLTEFHKVFYKDSRKDILLFYRYT